MPSSKSEYFYEGEESTFINGERLERTLKFVPTNRTTRISAGELLNVLAAYVGPEDIEGVYKVSQFDSTYSIQFKFRDTMDKISALKTLTVANRQFEILKLNEQMVTIRVHWLPLYYDSLILHEIFQDFGQVTNITSLKTAHANCVTLDGVREVRLKTDEVSRHNIPHIVHLPSGQSLLLTMIGRPPYCLKCKTVGHTRKDCPKNRFSNVVVEPVPPPVHSGPAPGPTPTPVAEAPVAPPTEPSGSAGGSTESRDRDEAAVKGDSVQEGDGMDQLTDQSLKRQLDDSQDSFIPPNRPVSRRRMVSENELKLSNSFAPIYSVDDIMSPRPSDK